MNNITKHKKNNILLFIFFLSGFSGLVYQSIWSHYLKQVLGHAAYSQTLVLIIFMGGISLGAWLASRYSSRIAAPLKWYAVTELIIGLFGLLFHQEFLFFHYLVFEILIHISDSPSLSAILKWTGISLAILPQSILLGTTFPLMSSAIIRNDNKRSGYILGSLYFSNSIGAALGVLVSGLYLIETTGLPGTVFIAGCINILVAAGAWLIYRRSAETPQQNQKKEVHLTGVKNHRLPTWVLTIALFTGVASFFYEIGWIRMLSLVLGSTVQAFELMLCAFILGLALGSYYIRKKIDHLSSPFRALAWIQILMGMLAMATLPLYVESFSWVGWIFSSLARSDEAYVVYTLSSQIIALIIMLPASYMAGMTLPLLTNILLRNGEGESCIGRVYAFNTLGAILGVFLAVHLIMPVVGVKFLIVSGSLIDIGLGIGIIFIYFRPDNNQKQTLYLSAVIVVCIYFALTPFDAKVLASGVYRTGNVRDSDTNEMLFYRDGKTSSVALIKSENGTINLLTNGKGDASIYPSDQPYGPDEITMVMLATLPLAKKSNASTVANVGLGSGLTTHVLLGSDRVSMVDTIEIESAVVKASQLFGDRVKRAHTDPRSKIHIDDAKSFFATNKKNYDIIISEPSNPWMNGVASLYTVEFYNYVKKFLSDDGVFVQWLHLYEFNMDLVASVMKSVGDSFNHYQIYNSNNSDILIIASESNSGSDIDPWIFDHPGLKKELQRVHLSSKVDFDSRYLGNEEIFRPLFATYSAPENSDYYPYLGYHAPKAFHLKQSAGALTGLHSAAIPVLDWLYFDPRAESTISESKYFSAFHSQSIANAIIRNQISNIDNEEIQYSVTRINHPLPDQFTESELIDAYTKIASSINPYLSVATLDQYWKVQRAKYQQNSESMLPQWLALYHAISQYRADETIKIANEMFENERNLGNDQKQVLVIAMMTANVAGKDFDNALQLIRKFELYRRIDTLPLELRLLVGMTIQHFSN